MLIIVEGEGVVESNEDSSLWVLVSISERNTERMFFTMNKRLVLINCKTNQSLYERLKIVSKESGQVIFVTTH